MPADFPVPRSEIPKVEVSPQEYYERKLQMEAMADRIVQEFEEYSETNKRHINLRRWKHVGSRERCKLYKERAKYQTTVGAFGDKRQGAAGRVRKNQPSVWRDDVSEDSYSGVGPVSSRSSTSSGATNGRLRTRVASTDTTHVVSTTQTATEEEADTLRPNLMIGERPGRLEDAMHALVAKDHDELAMVVVFLHQEVADCSILAVLESPTDEEPYRFLGYKWFVKPSPAYSPIVKNRDSLYMEYTIVRKTSLGEVVGIHIMHSIDIDGFPDFHDRNCVRASMTISTLYYQKEEDVVEIFIMGNVGIGGTIGQSPVAPFFAADTMFGMPRSIDAGEAKRLTELVHARRRTRAAQGIDLRKTSVMCRLCRSEKKSYNLVSLVTCEICAQTVCTRCRVHKKVFESDGILGKFVKFNCCKTCVATIAETHLPPAVAPDAKAKQEEMPMAPPPRRHWSDASLPMSIYEEDAHSDVPSSPVHNPAVKTSTSSRGKISMASTTVSTVPSDRSLQSMSVDDLHHDEMYMGPKSISETSEFDQSFAILDHGAEQHQQDANSRDTFMTAISDLHDEDWASRSYYNGRNAHPHVLDPYSRAAQQQSPRVQYQDPRMKQQSPRVQYQDPRLQQQSGRVQYQDPRMQSQSPRVQYQDPRAQSQSPRVQYQDPRKQQYTESRMQQYHDPRMQQQQQQYHDPRQYQNESRMMQPRSEDRMQLARAHDNRIQLAYRQRNLSARAPPQPPQPQLYRHHSSGSTGSAGSAGSREEFISRMQQLSMLAEETYNTTRDNDAMLRDLHNTRQQQQQPLESRNRFFYY